MSTFAIILVTAILTAVMIAYVAVYVRAVIADDGAHAPRRNPPRSHHLDSFDPRGRLA